MRVNEVLRWGKRLTLLRVSTIMIVVTALLSVSIMAVTYYGSQVGNYIITIQEESLLGLSLSEDGVFEEGGTNTLLATGLGNLTNITYGNIPDKEFEHAGGTHNSFALNGFGKYFAYTFYLRNESDQAIGYVANLYLIENFLGVDAAIRVLVQRDFEDGRRDVQIYAKARPDGTPEVHNEYYIDKKYSTVPFYDLDNGLLTYQVDDLELHEVVKYSVFLWLEGWDDDCNDSIKGGAFRIGMDFAVVIPDE